jgi:3',5'-cyclic AMP phosphodiesterase CpdA
VVVSGDFVEHAKANEFKAARDYLARLPGPQLVVPGNHDLPFYDPPRRLRIGLRDYRRYIADMHAPAYRDDEMIVLGVDTPRKIPLKGGRINKRQVEYVLEQTCDSPPHVVKVLVTHHPLDLPAQYGRGTLAGRARTAVEALSPCIDLMLAGHLHLSSTGATAARYRSTGHSVIFAQAGTAISMRNKGEPNSFNVIQLSAECIQIRHYTWQEKRRCYQACPWERFDHGPQGWCKTMEPEHSEQIQL